MNFLNKKRQSNDLENLEMSRLSRHRNKKNSESIASENLLPLSRDKDLTFKQRQVKKQRYRERVSKKTIFLFAIILFLTMHLFDYVSNRYTNHQESIFLTSQPSDILQFTFVGDMMMDRGNFRKGNKEGYDVFFEKTKQLWDSSDIVMGNLESAVLNHPDKYSKNKNKEIHLKMETAGLDAIQNAGFTTLGIANNHIGDFGRKGMKNTIRTLEKRNLDFVGAGEDLSEALNYTLYEVNNITIGVLAVTDVFNKGFSATDNKVGALTTQTEHYLNLIKEVSIQSDYTVVYMHWGEEIPQRISERQKKLGREMVDSGADLIVGMHPHIIQPVEKYKNSLILYSLGNFIFEQEQTRTKDSVVANLRIDKQGEMKLEFIPLRIKNGVPYVTKNLFFKKRIYNELTKMINKDDYKIMQDTLQLDNFGYKFQLEDSLINET